MHVHAGRLFTFIRNVIGPFMARSSLLSFRAESLPICFGDCPPVFSVGVSGIHFYLKVGSSPNVVDDNCLNIYYANKLIGSGDWATPWGLAKGERRLKPSRPVITPS